MGAARAHGRVVDDHGRHDNGGMGRAADDRGSTANDGHLGGRVDSDGREGRVGD